MAQLHADLPCLQLRRFALGLGCVCGCQGSLLVCLHLARTTWHGTVSELSCPRGDAQLHAGLPCQQLRRFALVLGRVCGCQGSLLVCLRLARTTWHSRHFAERHTPTIARLYQPALFMGWPRLIYHASAQSLHRQHCWCTTFRHRSPTCILLSEAAISPLRHDKTTYRSL